MDPDFDVPDSKEDTFCSIDEAYVSMIRNKQKCQKLEKLENVPIYKNLLEKEARNGCPGKWFKNRTDFGERDRTTLIGWMVSVHASLSVELYNRGYDLSTNSLDLAIMYFDRSLEIDFLMPAVYMQCMASASLVLGIKVDSKISMTSSLFNFNRTNQYFSRALLNGAEQKICQDHNWELRLITPNDALSYYIDQLKLFDQQIVITMTQYLIEVGYHFSDVSLHEFPSGMAAGALYCSLFGFGLLDDWHSDYELLTGYGRVAMERLGERYATLHLTAAQSLQCSATFAKYVIPEMNYVAIIDIGRRWRKGQPVPPFDNQDPADEN